jgi:hypothetical protein
MSNVEQAQVGKIRVFACGGAGINIANFFESDRGISQDGMADLEITYVDTSLASIPADVSAEHFWKLEGADGAIDGSGGKRAENAKDIADHNLEILHKHPAGDLTIVVSSMTGGSGSVFANTIVSELLRQDKLVIVLAVGGDDTLQYIKNTISSLMSYDKIAQLRQRPVILHYSQNGQDGKKIKDVNAGIHKIISALQVLFSRQNRNLDSRDLYNALNFPEVTSYKPQVGVLTVNFGDLQIGDEQLITVATLSSNMDNTRINQLVEYQRVGVAEKFIAASSDKETLLKDDVPIHFAITDGFLDGVVKTLKKTQKQHEDLAAQRTIRNRLADESVETTDNGLVL